VAARRRGEDGGGGGGVPFLHSIHTSPGEEPCDVCGWWGWGGGRGGGALKVIRCRRATDRRITPSRSRG